MAVSENILMKNATTQIGKLETASLDILESVDIFWNSSIASLEITADLAMKYLEMKK